MLSMIAFVLKDRLIVRVMEMLFIVERVDRVDVHARAEVRHYLVGHSVVMLSVAVMIFHYVQGIV